MFTAALIDGLSTGEADLDGDGEVTVDELYDFLYQRVKSATPNQTPGKSGDIRGGVVMARTLAGPRVITGLEQTSASEPTQTFGNVWYRPEGTRGEDVLKMKAMTDRGTLDVMPRKLIFKGKWTSLEVTDIREVSLSRSGKDFVNSYVIVEYGNGQVAQFADGRNLGWSGMLGGTRKLREAIERATL